MFKAWLLSTMSFYIAIIESKEYKFLAKKYLKQASYNKHENYFCAALEILKLETYFLIEYISALLEFS